MYLQYIQCSHTYSFIYLQYNRPTVYVFKIQYSHIYLFIYLQ